MDDTARNFAFFSFPRVGHIGPTLPVVRALRARGHTVTYVVGDRFGGLVAETGARTLCYPSDFPASVPRMTTSADLAEVVAAYLREGIAPLPIACTELAGRPVDVVVEDALSTVASRLVAERADCPVVRVFPGLAGNEQVPINGVEPGPGDPSLDPDHPAITAVAAELPERVRSCGLDTAELDRIRTARAAAANLVFVPRAFQPRAECFTDDFVFVGPSSAARPAAAAAGWRPRADAAKVALVTLGTSANGNPGFFRSCADAFAGTGWQVLMAGGGHMDPAEMQDMPRETEPHAWLDFDAVLPHVDVMVCQAGAGTLMDAFRHGVPVVAVPQQPDARATAERTEQLGLGRVVRGEATGTAVRDAAMAVACDGRIARNVALMEAEIRGCPGAEGAADVLERIAAGQGSGQGCNAA
ncbi:glycosyltransferase [Streptomonospora sediminis]